MNKLSIVGGCGHVGLPLGVQTMLAGIQTTLIDIDQQAVDGVLSGSFPFKEKGGDEMLQRALTKGLKATTSASACSDSDVVVFVTGTPVDEHLNPKISDITNIFADYLKLMAPEALVVMRSTLFPGTLEHLKSIMEEVRPDLDLAFCPERVAQGVALEEMHNLPQIVSAFGERGLKKATELFSRMAPKLVILEPFEAELAKLMANSWRYLEFAIANQFYMIAEKSGADFYKIFDALRFEYPRAKGYKTPGFAAGPCLFKDTMQLASFCDHQFHLGHSAMLVNEGLAAFAAQKAEALFEDKRVAGKKIGLLGMTFKPESDDVRESLSFRVKKLLEFKGAKVFWHDPYLEGSEDLESLLAQVECLVLTTPHKVYRSLEFTQPIVDVWGIFNRADVRVVEPNKVPASDQQEIPELR
jgi:UDP-N-acetyl-D-mannosaminuronic acid dehydrogenase